MRAFRIVKRPLIALALLPVPNMFAANRGSLHVSSPEEVVGQRLEAGDNIVRWEGDGPDVELKIMQGRKLVATAKASMIPLQYASANDSEVVNVREERRSLSLIFFSGKTVALEIQGLAAGVNVSSK